MVAKEYKTVRVGETYPQTIAKLGQHAIIAEYIHNYTVSQKNDNDVAHYNFNAH